MHLRLRPAGCTLVPLHTILSGGSNLTTSKNILGICAYHGDASAALVVDGKLVAAVEEERYRRIKHWAGLPTRAMADCLRMGGLEASDVDLFAVGRDPSAHLLRKVFWTATHAPSSALVRDRVRNSQRLRALPGSIGEALGLQESHVRSRLRYVEHHAAHLASSFFVSPFDEAAVCAIDGFGDFVSTSVGVGRGNTIEIQERTFFPHSLGLLYLAVTQHLGFNNYGDEFKVMGLAAYGKPTQQDAVRRLIRLKSNGRFELELRHFRHAAQGVQMSWDEGEPRTGAVFQPSVESFLGPRRDPKAPLTADHENLAASLQAVFEASVFHILRDLHERTGLHDLALAGGCAMNSVANGKIRANTPFKRVFIQSAAADNGTSLGAAFYAWNQLERGSRGFVMEHSHWGPSFSDDEIARVLKAKSDAIGACKVNLITDEDELCTRAARDIAAGLVVGWYQGRMEWGARALGNRSIVADPRRADMRDIINVKIKFRERFRPFAPSVLEEGLSDYFVDPAADPFMLQVYPVRPDKRAEIPAVTHADGTGRIQAVSDTTNPRYARLIRAFQKETGVPMVLNTSFNENEPIVLRPEEALDCFLRTRMDVLYLGGYAIRKAGA